MRTIEVSDETWDKIKDMVGEDDAIELSCYDDLVGKKWFFRTVTYHLVGKVVGRFGSFLRLENASWVADSGRFMDAIKKGSLSEVEPVGDANINLYSITDFFPWKHKLPKEQK